MDWTKLLYNNCPSCGFEMTREKKAWKQGAKERVYFNCWDCDFAISEEKRTKIVGEPKKVGFWIGIVKRIGKSQAYQIMSEIRQRDQEFLNKPGAVPIKSKAKLFVWKAKNCRL